MDTTTNEPLLRRWQPWFYAAAVYNLAWGSWVVLDPNAYFELIGMPPPSPLAIWQVVGMFVLLWAPAYWWAARYPDRHAHLILLAMLGKILGPIGFAIGVISGSLPLVFGLTILTNDLIWWPPFGSYLRFIARRRGGWIAFIGGE
jgi:small multidrug resistance pump